MGQWAKRILCHLLGCMALIMALIGTSGTLSMMFGVSGSQTMHAVVNAGYPTLFAAIVGGLVLLPGFVIGMPPYRMISGWAWPHRAHLGHVLLAWAPIFGITVILFYCVAKEFATPVEALFLQIFGIFILGFAPCILVHRWAEAADHREVVERFA